MSTPDLFTCQRCNEEFNDGDRAPILLRECRHTFCKRCIEAVIAEAQNVKLSFGHCPACDKQFFFSPQPADFYKNFQRNAEIYAKLIPWLNQTVCRFHANQKKTYVCLSPACPVKERFCAECAKGHHPSCANKLTINEASFPSIVRFSVGMMPAACFNKQALAAQIKAELQGLETYLMSLVDSVEERFLEDQAKLDKIMQEQDLFLQNKHLFSFKESSILTELTFEPKNEKIYGQFGAFISETFGLKLWNDLHRAVNFGLLRFFDEKKGEAAQLFPEWEPVYQRSAQIHPNIRNELLLENWSNGKVFSFDRFFSGIRAKLSGVNVRFLEYESKLFDKGMVYFAHKSIHKAFAQAVLDPRSITLAIANEFNEEYKNGFFNFLNGNKNYTWHAALEFLPASPLKVGSKYIRLRSEKHELTIYTKE